MNSRTLDRIALVAALLALVVLGLRPATTRLVDPSLLVLRTPGATVAEARAVAESLGARSVDGIGEAARSPGAQVHLVGWGLDEGELRWLDAEELVLHPRPLPDGIQRVRWTGSLFLGDPLVVRGSARAGTSGWLVLGDENGPVDSLRIDRGAVSEFTLRHTPRATGALLYTLRLGSVADTFSILVTEATPPATLILAAAPSREWSDLRDWLAGQGGRVAMRTTLSRGEIRTDRMNGAEVPRIDRASLSRIAVVITDGRTIASLTVAERSALGTAVNEGLGVILLLDGTTRDTEGGELRRFVPWRQVSAGEIEVRDVRPEFERVRASETPVAAEAFVIDPRGARPVLEDGRGGILAATERQGRGRITGTLVTGAGRWLRGGESDAYATYWSALIRSTARPDLSVPRWEVGDRPTVIDGEVELVRWGAGAGIVVLAEDSVTLVSDPLYPAKVGARWWPRREGWNEVGELRVWVGGNESWQGWRGVQRRDATERWISEHRGGKETPGGRVPERAPWPLWPFFLAFVASAGWLWRRISG